MENNQDEESIIIKVRSTVQGRAVVVLGLTDCCMTHVVKQLLYGLGVGPTIIDLDEDDGDTEAVLYHLCGGGAAAAKPPRQALPAIFIGGKLLGGVESLLASHIKGSLVPLLKQAGALWL